MSQVRNFESLLRKAIDERKKAPPGALSDLIGLASEANNAIMAVTKNAAMLRLEPIRSNDPNNSSPSDDWELPTFQLVFRKVGGDSPPSDFGVYRLSKNGFPIKRWYSRENWLAHPKKADVTLTNLAGLVNNFEYLVSHPESRLVALISYFDK